MTQLPPRDGVSSAPLRQLVTREPKVCGRDARAHTTKHSQAYDTQSCCRLQQECGSIMQPSQPTACRCYDYAICGRVCHTMSHLTHLSQRLISSTFANHFSDHFSHIKGCRHCREEKQKRLKNPPKRNSCLVFERWGERVAPPCGHRRHDGAIRFFVHSSRLGASVVGTWPN